LAPGICAAMYRLFSTEPNPSSRRCTTSVGTPIVGKMGPDVGLLHHDHERRSGVAGAAERHVLADPPLPEAWVVREARGEAAEIVPGRVVREDHLVDGSLELRWRECAPLLQAQRRVERRGPVQDDPRRTIRVGGRVH
jgi:hypothetical protein